MTDLPKTTTLDLETSAGWLTIWLNQPDKRNALTDALRSDLITVFHAIRDDRGIRGVTLRGRGGLFCAGGDMKRFRADFQATASKEDILTMSREAAAIMDVIHDAPQVTIAIVEGAAMAGGFGMMCCADIVIAEAGAKFGMTEAAIGLSPAQIAPFVIKRVGEANAKRLMITAETLTGPRAQAMGLVDFLADDLAGLDTLEAQIKAHVQRCSPHAVAETKILLQQLAGLSRPATIEAAAEVFARQMQSSEAREGVASFLEKRKPRWATDPI
jgi:isohexenylglutaconyl-CoA hydratase